MFIFIHRLIMGTQEEPLVDFTDENPTSQMETTNWNNLIEIFYNWYCAGEAQAGAYEKSTIYRTSTKKTNVLSPAE
jgi:hypothetical protein